MAQNGMLKLIISMIAWLRARCLRQKKRKNLPPSTKVIDITWACKKISNGTLHGRLNARGFKQREGQHYDGSSIHAPVTNPATIRIIMNLMLMDGMVSAVVDAKEHSCIAILKTTKRYPWKSRRDLRSTTKTEWYSN